METLRGSEAMQEGASGSATAADQGNSEPPPARSFEPSSLGLTVLLPRSAMALKARVTWGDYVTEPPLKQAVLLADVRAAAEEAGQKTKEPPKNSLDWRRIPREERLSVPVGICVAQNTIVVLNSAAPQVPGGGLQLVVSARPTRTARIDGVHRDLVAVSIFLVNARAEMLRRFGDLAFCFLAPDSAALRHA